MLLKVIYRKLNSKWLNNNLLSHIPATSAVRQTSGLIDSAVPTRVSILFYFSAPLSMMSATSCSNRNVDCSTLMLSVLGCFSCH